MGIKDGCFGRIRVLVRITARITRTNADAVLVLVNLNYRALQQVANRKKLLVVPVLVLRITDKIQY